MKKTCDCIIPFYNEGTKPLYVVKSINKIKSFSKIIVVDDGSTEKSNYKKLRAKFPQITAIRLEKNSGKANAVKEGLKHVGSKYVFLIDGDLSNIQPAEIEKAIKKITNNPHIDMIILPLVPETIAGDFFRWYTILSGQRILKRVDLEKIYKDKFSGFQLETAVNCYMIKNNKKVYWMNSSIRHHDKYLKWGKKEGLKKVIGLIKEFANYAGWRNLIWQSLFFCRKKAL